MIPGIILRGFLERTDNAPLINGTIYQKAAVLGTVRKG
jgi:hypothetical protein